MKHFEIAECSDFVRGLVSPARREVMSSHLAAGCRSCSRTMSILGAVAALAAGEPRYDVPDFAVHCARAVYALEQPREVRVLDGLIGRLVFDSFREPLAAGVRSGQRISRQSLYEAGDYAVDLRQEHERGSPQVSVVGQIADRRVPGGSLEGVRVVLSSGDSVLARAVSNRYGEFHMEYTPARDLRLEVGAAPERCLSAGGSWPEEPGGFE